MIGLHDIIGQDDAVARLQAAMHGQRMPHAFLFVGPEGVGRRTTAQAMAATLLCSKPVEQALLVGPPFRIACGRCEDCLLLAAGTHGDLHTVYKELARYHDDPAVRGRVMQDLGIDVIRSFLIAPAGRSAGRGRGKVFIVLEAELMSNAAQNALLKTLEEPPPNVTIILVCSQAEQLLPTTLSRCSMVRFGPLPAEFVTQRLVAAGVDEAQAGFWAAYTAGSLGVSLRLAGQGMYEVKCDVISRLAAMPPAGDAELSEHLAKLTEKLADDAVAAAKKLDGAELSRSLASRRAAGTMLELIASAYCDAMAVATGSLRPLIHSDQRGAIASLAERFAPIQLAEIVDDLGLCEQLLWRNLNNKIVWDNVVIACATAVTLRV